METAVNENSKTTLTEVLSVSLLAEALKVPTGTIYYWISREPKFPYIRMGRHLRFHLQDVLDYFDEKTKIQKSGKFPVFEVKKKTSADLHLRDSSLKTEYRELAEDEKTQAISTRQKSRR